MIPAYTMKRWEQIAENWHFNTLSEFIMTAVEFYIRNV